MYTTLKLIVPVVTFLGMSGCGGLGLNSPYTQPNLFDTPLYQSYPAQPAAPVVVQQPPVVVSSPAVIPTTGYSVPAVPAVTTVPTVPTTTTTVIPGAACVY